jgi:hypothetical protein
VQRKEFLVTRPTTAPLAIASLLLAVVCVVNGFPLLRTDVAGAAVVRTKDSAVQHATQPARAPHACTWKLRSVKTLPLPRVNYQTPYVPGRCDPMRRLPKQAWRLFECVRWREGGDTADQPNGAGMYQFTNRATWDEFKGRFPDVPSDATPLEQDIVAYRAWKTEQFLPWNGDPCLGSVHQYGKWGWY